MKTTEIAATAETQRILYFAERLRDLVMEASENGIQLSIPEIEDKPEIKKKQPFYTQYRTLMTIPCRFDHQFLGQPLYVSASAIIDTRPKKNVLDLAILRPADLVYGESLPDPA
jgi:hypothetical protein